jgi:hypothetical protein
MGTRKFRTKLAGVTAAAAIVAGCSAETPDPRPTPGPDQEQISQLDQIAQQAAGKLACMLGDNASGAEAYDNNNFGNKNYILGQDLVPHTPDDGNQSVEMGARRALSTTAILHASWASPQDPNTSIRVEVQGSLPPKSRFLDVTKPLDLEEVNSATKDMEPKHVSITNGDYTGMLARNVEGNIFIKDGSSDDQAAPSASAIEEFARLTEQSLLQLNSTAGTECN